MIDWVGLLNEVTITQANISALNGALPGYVFITSQKSNPSYQQYINILIANVKLLI